MTLTNSAKIMEGKAGTTVLLDGSPCLYFAGTSYFQLHSHPDVIQAAVEACQSGGMGSATTRSMTGTTPLLLELEQKAASFFHTEDAVYLPSGYLSSLAGLQALKALGKYERIFLDECAHYSLQEGAMATGLPVEYFRNGDVSSLEKQLEKKLLPEERPLIGSDGLFPISAQLAPLDGFVNLADKYDGVVWIDDAHGVGILGASGKGTAEELNVSSNRLYMGTTLSKAFGSYGGIIPGNTVFTDAVRSTGVMSGSSAPLNAAVASGIKSLEILNRNPGLRKKLQKNARQLKEGLTSLGIQCREDEIPIVSFTLGNSHSMESIQASLLKEGIYIQYTHYKGAGSEGVLRVVVSSSHSAEEIQKLIDALLRAQKSLRS